MLEFQLLRLREIQRYGSYSSENINPHFEQ